METLFPNQVMLRVEDKYCPDFVLKDKALPSTPTLLYGILFQRCAKTRQDRCRILQADLALRCKCSIRSLQNHLRTLSRLGYLHVERDEESGLNFYILLLSARIRDLIALTGTELLEAAGRVGRSSSAGSPSFPDCAPPAQHLREGGAKSADSYIRDQRDPRSPLTPLPANGPSAAGKQGGGDSPVRMRSRLRAHPDTHRIQADFAALWAAYPLKQNRTGALREFQALNRDNALPPMDRLLETVKLFSAQDDRWRRGYAPNLVNWLRDRRWEDEIRPSPTECQDVREGLNSRDTAALRAKVQAVHERFGSRLFSVGDDPTHPDKTSLARNKLHLLTFMAKFRNLSPEETGKFLREHGV